MVIQSIKLQMNQNSEEYAAMMTIAKLGIEIGLTNARLNLSQVTMTQALGLSLSPTTPALRLRLLTPTTLVLKLRPLLVMVLAPVLRLLVPTTPLLRLLSPMMLVPRPRFELKLQLI